MNNLDKTIKAFCKLSDYINLQIKDISNSELQPIIEKAYLRNNWFTVENVIYSLENWSRELTEENLKKWILPYKIPNSNPKKIGIVMAGNIPLVGFHDFLSVLISGNILMGKLSSKDDVLIKFLSKKLINFAPSLNDYIFWENEQLKNFDAIIATGSSNTSRYFDYYFGRYPHIIRKNRNSIAIITGNETEKELTNLSNDIFQYFGLGCRNVSKLFIPVGYDITKIIDKFEHFNIIRKHNKYMNNYDYNKSIYLINNEPFLDNGFLLFKEDTAIASPIAVLFYEFYDDINSLKEWIKIQDENLQCIVAQKTVYKKAINFGQTQTPTLNDYADNIDTIKFLLTLK